MGSGHGEGPVRGAGAAGEQAPTGAIGSGATGGMQHVAPEAAGEGSASGAPDELGDNDASERPANEGIETEPLADLLAQIAGILSTRIVRGAYMQSMATLVAAGRSIDDAATIAGDLFETAERTVPDATVDLRPRTGQR